MLFLIESKSNAQLFKLWNIHTIEYYATINNKAYLYLLTWKSSCFNINFFKGVIKQNKYYNFIFV